MGRCAPFASTPPRTRRRWRAHALAIGQHVVLNVYELAGDVVPADIPAEGQAVPEDYFS
jgi:hypothetical protein